MVYLFTMLPIDDVVGGCDVDDVDTVLVTAFVVVVTVCFVEPVDVIDEDGKDCVTLSLDCVKAKDCVDWIGDTGGDDDGGCSADGDCGSDGDCGDGDFGGAADDNGDGKSDGSGDTGINDEERDGGSGVNGDGTVDTGADGGGDTWVDSDTDLSGDVRASDDGGCDTDEVVDGGGCGNDFDCVCNDSGDDWFDANSDIDCDSCSCNDENSVNSTTGNVVTDPDA